MKQYNLAANFIAEKAFQLKLANKYELQKRFYHEIRERFQLSAQFAIRVISKVVEAYKRNKLIRPAFRELAPFNMTSEICLGRGWIGYR